MSFIVICDKCKTQAPGLPSTAFAYAPNWNTVTIQVQNKVTYMRAASKEYLLCPECQRSIGIDPEKVSGEPSFADRLQELLADIVREEMENK